MPDPRAFTGQSEAIANVASQALNTPEGITLRWTVAQYGSMEACKRMARSFQQSFTSLRARARRLNMKALGERDERDLTARGPFDKLGCIRCELPDLSGWYVWLGPAVDMFSSVEIIDNATGKPLEMIGRDRSELDALIHKAATRPETITIEDYDRALELDPRFWDDPLDPSTRWFARERALGFAHANDGEGEGDPFESLGDDIFGTGVDNGGEEGEG